MCGCGGRRGGVEGHPTTPVGRFLNVKGVLVVLRRVIPTPSEGGSSGQTCSERTGEATTGRVSLRNDQNMIDTSKMYSQHGRTPNKKNSNKRGNFVCPDFSVDK